MAGILAAVAARPTAVAAKASFERGDRVTVAAARRILRTSQGADLDSAAHALATPAIKDLDLRCRLRH